MTFSSQIQTVKVQLAYEKAAKAVEELKDEHGEDITFPPAIYCKAEPDNCISERLYHQQADALVSQGFLDMGYNAIHMDDCWERKIPPRDVKTGRLVGDPIRFPCATATDRSSAAARFTLCLCS